MTFLRVYQEYSAKVAFSIFQSLKRIHPLPVCAGFFICIRNSLDRPCVAMPSWSSPLKCKVSLWGTCFIQKIYAPPLPYFKVKICPLPLPHFASIFFAYLWSFRWPNYIVTLPRYFSFRLLHLNINTGTPSEKVAFSILQSLKRIQSLPVRSKLI
jgi:hypothetical protein